MQVTLTASTPTMSTVVGTGVSGTGTEGSANTILLNSPRGMAFDAAMTTMLVADTDNHCVRKVETGQTGRESRVLILKGLLFRRVKYPYCVSFLPGFLR